MPESSTTAMIGQSQSCFLRNSRVVVSVCETLRGGPCHVGGGRTAAAVVVGGAAEAVEKIHRRR